MWKQPFPETLPALCSWVFTLPGMEIVSSSPAHLDFLSLCPTRDSFVFDLTRLASEGCAAVTTHFQVDPFCLNNLYLPYLPVISSPLPALVLFPPPTSPSSDE